MIRENDAPITWTDLFCMLSCGNLEVWCRSGAPWNQHPTGQTSTGLVSQGAGWRLGAFPHRFWDMHPARSVMDASAVQEVCGLLGYEEFCHHQSNSTGQVLTWRAVRQGGSSYLQQVEHKSLTVVHACLLVFQQGDWFSWLSCLTILTKGRCGL